MDSYLIEINAVSLDSEKFNCDYTVEAESIADAFNKFIQSKDLDTIRQFAKNGYCNLSCHWVGTKGTEPPASDSSS